MDSEVDIKQRRQLSQWRLRTVGQALWFGGAAGGITAAIGALGDVELAAALSPFIGLVGVGFILTNASAPKHDARPD